MQFSKIRLIGLSTVDLPIVGALPTDNYILKGADGLGPVPMDVLIDGGVYRGSQPQDREIVLRIGLNPTYASGMTAESLRTTLYGLLAPGGDGSMSIEFRNGTSQAVAVTQGYVKQIETALFTKDPEVQVTISCAKPYLSAPTKTSLTTLDAKNIARITNPGTAPTGFLMRVNFTGQRALFSLTTADLTKKMEFTGVFYVGDILEFDTRDGQKSIHVNTVSDGAWHNKIDILTTDSVWLQLQGGLNAFTVSTTTYNLEVVEFTPQYLGV